MEITLRIWFKHNDDTFYLDAPSEIMPTDDNYAAWRAIERYDERHGTHWLDITTTIVAVSVVKDGKPLSDYADYGSSVADDDMARGGDGLCSE